MSLSPLTAAPSSGPAAAPSDAGVVALLLADARLPSGGHVNSAGLEPALMAGLSRSEVPQFLQVRARTAALVDAATAVVTSRSLFAAGSETELELGPLFRQLDRAWAARTPSQASRHIARELGRGLHRLAAALWPQAPGLRALGLQSLGQTGGSVSERVAPPRPLVLGAVAAHVGLGAEELMRLAVYDDVASAAAALLKLDPGDPVEAMAMVLQACRAAEPAVQALAGITAAGQIPAPSAPQTEEWIEAHTLTTRRLFRA
ncbi:urease accessory UreF family protein [Nesterenkonia sp. CL21]|uniref:urease accessory UreF family protein n=1 Tax=Nesterenkonia sp. CL21 TaxID=3064894 RepID=UPI0028787F53|nr:urease accessory UreF family protein [Nesterenkonia sp. CL21]MDS2173717.1 urease accessory UreF family protein [Nesterenkonia sp. CL21]